MNGLRKKTTITSIIIIVIFLTGGAVLMWLHMQTHNTGVFILIPPCVTTKTPLARKSTGSRLIKSISLEKLRALYLASATLEMEYATQFYVSY